MDRSFYFNDQYVLGDDLNNSENTKSSAITTRTIAVTASGSIVGTPAITAS